MALGQFAVAVGPEHEHPHGRVGCGQVAEQAAGSPLSAHWRSSRTRTTGWCCDIAASSPTTAAKSKNRSVSESVALDGGRSGIRLASAGTSRDSSDPWAATWARSCVFGGVGDVVAEGLGEELVGGGEVLLAVAEQHAGPVVERGPGRLGHQGGLAQTGLTRDEEDLAAVARRPPA